jgi:beta-lactamase regulating signal transducer with metallopeptidase domain
MRTLADFLFSAILNALWMTPLLVVAVEAGTRLFGQLRGHMLYRIWMASFFLALLLPMLPAISVHWPEREAAAVAVQPSGIARQEAPRSAMQKVESDVAAFYPQQATPVRDESGMETLCCLFYGACFLLALLRLQTGLAHTNRVVGDAGAALLSEEADNEWRQTVEHYRLLPVDLLSSRFLDSPAAVHWPRAMVILPKTFDGGDEEELRTIFSHELAHVRRGDFFANLVVELLGSVLFFHPALHWIKRRIVESRELATDELAAEAMPSKTAYARSLVRLAERFHSKSIIQPICSLGIFEGGTLEKRIMQLTEKRFSMRQMAIAVFSTALLVLAVCIFSAQMGGNPLQFKLVQQEPSKQPQQAAQQASGNTTISWDIPPEVDWIIRGTRPGRPGPQDIKMSLDKVNSYKGQPTYSFQFIGDKDPHRGSVAERFIDARPYRGKRVHVQTMFRTLGNLDFPTHLSLMTPTNELFESNLITGENYQRATNWTSVDYIVDVPRNARSIYLGLSTGGKFKIWVTEPHVEIMKTGA